MNRITARHRAKDLCEWLRANKSYDQLDRHKNEKELCKMFTAETFFSWESHPRIKTEYFGWPEDKPDFRPKNDHAMVIEVKYLKKGNECDVKNALAQTLLQAFGAHADHAMLVIFDRGRASSRVWNNDEDRIIQFFKQNPFGIDLAVARIRLDEVSKAIEYETR
jgi:hypothetical protein